MSGSSNGNNDGRPLGEVWEHFHICVQCRSSRHREAICKYCDKKWAKGQPAAMKKHLLLGFRRCPQEVKHQLASSEFEAEQTRQPRLDRHFETAPMADFYRKSANDALLKTMVMCNLASNIVDNQLLKQFLKMLRPSYDLFSSYTFRENLLYDNWKNLQAKYRNETRSQPKYSIILEADG